MPDVFLKCVLALVSLTVACLPCPGSERGVNYYIDAVSGNDAASGLSAGEAWRSLSKVCGLRLQPGDSLLLRRGTTFCGQLEVSGRGMSARRIVVGAYGVGEKPRVVAPDSSYYAVRVRNSDYLTLRELEVVNRGTARLAGRTGVLVECENYGVSHHVVLEALYVHDVNGSLVKKEGGGSGILVRSHWDENGTVSVFDSLTIENCVVRRCERNAIIWSAPWSRRDWHPSTHTVVRGNLIEEVPGDGIVPIGCEGALVEYNLMRRCTDLLPQGEAAAGIWPWSCDNTLIRFNEVSGHKAPWDGQGFDADYNCTNTVIQYNYSHGNDGGFVLICNAGGGETDPADNLGNQAPVVRYNVSIGDGVRRRRTRTGDCFSPAIHISGPCTRARIERNILHVERKPSAEVHRAMVVSDSWGGYADSTLFRENVFYAPQPSAFRLGRSTGNRFDANYYLGVFEGRPDDAQGRVSSVRYLSQKDQSPEAAEAFGFLFREVTVGDGAAVLKAVRPEKIQSFFEEMRQAD